jgi:hypothetical protein
MDIIKKYSKFFESLRVSLNMSNILDYLFYKKKNKVAAFLFTLRNGNLYKDDEDLNYISTAVENNMISYLSTNKRGTDWEDNMNNQQRTSIRIGRGINRLFNKIKPYLTCSIKDNANIIKSRHRNKYYIDFDKEYNFIFFDEGEANEIAENKKVEIKLKVDGKSYDCKFLFLENDDNITTLTIECQNFIECPVAQNWEWSSYSRISIQHIKNVEIELKSNISITDSDIEKFTNEYVSYVKMNRSDETSHIIEVKGQDIRYWYNSNNYQSNMGKLGNSCMSHEECSEYLNIYVDNIDVISLLILKNKNEKLVGRALLWKLDDGRMFMDRIYTTNDSDDNIFINYAIEKGYIYRNTSNQKIKYYKDGKEIPKEQMVVTLKYEEYEYYPYIDTLCYLNENTLSNTKRGYARELRDTEGAWIQDEENNDDDD